MLGRIEKKLDRQEQRMVEHGNMAQSQSHYAPAATTPARNRTNISLEQQRQPTTPVRSLDNMALEPRRQPLASVENKMETKMVSMSPMIICDDYLFSNDKAQIKWEHEQVNASFNF